MHSASCTLRSCSLLPSRAASTGPHSHFLRACGWMRALACCSLLQASRDQRPRLPDRGVSPGLFVGLVTSVPGSGLSWSRRIDNYSSPLKEAAILWIWFLARIPRERAITVSERGHQSGPWEADVEYRGVATASHRPRSPSLKCSNGLLGRFHGKRIQGIVVKVKLTRFCSSCAMLVELCTVW